MADEQAVDSGTETAEVETGKDATQDTPVEKTAADTDSDESGVLSKEDLEKAANAGEEKPDESPKDEEVAGEETQDVLRDRVKKEKDARKKLGISLERERAENSKLREESAYHKGQVDALKAEGMSQKQAEKVVAKTTADMPAFPDMDDFSEQEDYRAAIKGWVSDFPKWMREDFKREQREEESLKKGEADAQAVEQERNEEYQRIAKRQNEILSEIGKKFGDEVVKEILHKAKFQKEHGHGGFVLTEAMRDAVFTCDAPADTLNFLAGHPDIAKKIGAIEGHTREEMRTRQTTEINRVANKIIMGQSATVSKAPEPITKIMGGGVNRKPTMEMNTDELAEFMYPNKFS